MDRYSPRLIRGVAAAGVSLFLVAGAAFAANAVMGAPRSVARDLVPAAASSPSGTTEVEASETAEPGERAEPSETPDSTRGSAKPTGTARASEKAEGTEKPEASESPEPSEGAEPTRSPNATRTTGPTEVPDAEDRSGDDAEQSREHDGARPTPTAGTIIPGPGATPAPTRSLERSGDGSAKSGNG